MPAYSKTANTVGLKWVNSYPKNRARGLPTVMGLIIINDPATAEPRAILEASLLTNIRTGAAGGVATKYLANKNATKLSIIGAGVQGLYQAKAILEVRDIEEIKIFDPSKETCDSFREQLASSFSGKIFHTASPEACVRGAEVLVTATPSRQPIVKAEWVAKGCHINAIGADAPGKQELAPGLVAAATIFVDDIEQASHSGEINVPLTKQLLPAEKVKNTLGEVVANQIEGRTSPDQITLFDSTGLAIQDVAVASWIVEHLAGADVSAFDF